MRCLERAGRRSERQPGWMRARQRTAPTSARHVETKCPPSCCPSGHRCSCCQQSRPAATRAVCHRGCQRGSRSSQSAGGAGEVGRGRRGPRSSSRAVTSTPSRDSSRWRMHPSRGGAARALAQSHAAHPMAHGAAARARSRSRAAQAAPRCRPRSRARSASHRHQRHALTPHDSHT